MTKRIAGTKAGALGMAVFAFLLLAGCATTVHQVGKYVVHDLVAGTMTVEGINLYLSGAPIGVLDQDTINL